MLATASSDGYITILTSDSNDFRPISFKAHNISVNSVSWSPSVYPSHLNTKPSPRIVSGGSDNDVKIWFQKPDQTWGLEEVLEGHEDWVRDVSWASNIGYPYSMIASCGQDKKVLIWTKSENSGNWNQKLLPFDIDEVVWRVSWNGNGNILAVCSGDNRVTLWKEGLEHDWIDIEKR